MKFHTEKYILDTFKRITKDIIHRKTEGNQPNWNLIISSEKCFSEVTDELLINIGEGILKGYDEGETFQFINDEREVIYWELKITWKNAKRSYIWFDNNEVELIMKTLIKSLPYSASI
jgi:hypothetical protein